MTIAELCLLAALVLTIAAIAPAKLDGGRNMTTPIHATGFLYARSSGPVARRPLNSYEASRFSPPLCCWRRCAPCRRAW